MTDRELGALDQEFVTATPAALEATAAQDADRSDDGFDFSVFRVTEGMEYRVTLSREDVASINMTAAMMGLGKGSRGTDDEGAAEGERGDGIISYGWSDNDDSRTRRTNTTVWPYRTIGTLYDGGGDCTGTLIGPRHVLTAAHCIYSRSSHTYSSFNFKPGRNGENSAPYGASNSAIDIWVPWEYKFEPSNVNQWDIALIILEDPVGNGWMGYAAQPGSFLDDQSIYMRGYPRCGTTGSPVGCEPKTLWGDTKRCEVGTFFSMDPDGWNREIKTNCDGSKGQSGSSFYYNNSDANPVSVGVFSHHYCLAGCPNSIHNEWPNVFTRITPEYLAMINLYRAAYPN